MRKKSLFWCPVETPADRNLKFSPRVLSVLNKLVRTILFEVMARNVVERRLMGGKSLPLVVLTKPF